MRRREWLLAVGGLGAMTASRVARAQDPVPSLVDSSNLFAMDQGAARSVRLTPKPGARPMLTPGERDQLERRIHCQCGCTLDVYTCRTTDFSCQVSPAMHRDVMALVEGGYDAQEILDAFVNVYGERALMAPTREGFNALAWVVPGSAIAVGAVVLGALLRRRERSRPAAATAGTAPAAAHATPEEMARIEAAIRNDA